MNKPIGVFDSGVGGLTVLNSLIANFPNENFIYLGDTARVPYGTKGSQTVRRYSMENATFLFTHDVKMIVVACNTASSVAIPDLERSFDVPILGVVKASAKEAFSCSKTKHIGVVGTTRTVTSEAYTEELMEISNSVKVFGQPCPLFVPLVEEGWVNNHIAKETARIYLSPMTQEKIDTLILGCTHYPLLTEIIQEVMGESVKLVASGDATSKEVKRILEELKIENSDSDSKLPVKYFVTDDSEGFDKIGTRFVSGSPIFSKKVDLVQLT
jgi:glutamate racemase